MRTCQHVSGFSRLLVFSPCEANDNSVTQVESITQQATVPHITHTDATARPMYTHTDTLFYATIVKANCMRMYSAISVLPISFPL